MARVSAFLLSTAAAASLLSSCKEVPLTAAEGAELSMSANPLAIPADGGVSTITVVGFKSLEDGGGPVSDGTQIFFTADLGVIEERVATQNGIARASLRSNGRSGTATVNARSGAGITAEPVTVEIGLSGDVFITVTANPATLGPDDISSAITATITDANGNPIANAPVIFGTSAGSLASAGSVVRTNVSGQAFDRLTLLDDQGDSATVTATSGGSFGDVTVTRGSFDPPLIDSVSPATGSRGASLTLTITGQNFRAGATVSLGAGIDIREVVFVNSETLRATIRIDGQAPVGSRTVTVTNTDGGVDMLEAAFTVNGTAPICRARYNPAPSGGDGTQALPFVIDTAGAFVVGFDATASVDPDGTIAEYRWNVGDPPTQPLIGAAVSHNYGAGGVFQVSLTITDNDEEVCILVNFLDVQ